MIFSDEAMVSQFVQIVEGSFGVQPVHGQGCESVLHQSAVLYLRCSDMLKLRQAANDAGSGPGSGSQLCKPDHVPCAHRTVLNVTKPTRVS